MTDMGATITPKSDQLNADDLTVEPRTIRITKVSANPGSAEQPISIFFEGDNGKPYKPCKSMRRVLVQVWGCDGAEYVGRRMTLFRDPSVQWGGVAVGGIRISHMSDIARTMSLMLTASKTSRKPYTVDPLANGEPPPPKKSANGEDVPLADRVAGLIKFIGESATVAEVDKRMSNKHTRALLDQLDEDAREKLKVRADEIRYNIAEREGMKS